MARGKGEDAPLGYEARLWQMADALRNNMDAAEYKHVVLGLKFLKYISDAFESKYAGLALHPGQGADSGEPEWAARIRRRPVAIFKRDLATGIICEIRCDKRRGHSREPYGATAPHLLPKPWLDCVSSASAT
jgi:hypothetical protein